MLEVANVTTRVRGLQDILENINTVIYQKNDTISKIEDEIVKRNALIEKKQGTIDQLNRKIESLFAKNGESNYSVNLRLSPFGDMSKTLKLSDAVPKASNNSTFLYWGIIWILPYFINC